MDYNSLHSDDDFDCSNSYGDSSSNGSQSRIPNPNGLSKAELRKSNKPIMEKRRRARINHCLNELKSLILEAMKKDPARHTKLEKADILEMTVKHLQSVQRQQLTMAIQTDPTVIHKFKTGFVECTDEVNRYISQLDGVDAGVRQRLSNHLNNCASGLDQIGSMTNFSNGYRSQANAAAMFGGNVIAPAVVSTAGNPLFPLPQDLNNNSNSSSSQHGTPIQMGGVHLIPSRLPSGEFALIMPNSNTAATGVEASINNNNNNNNLSTPFATWANNMPTAGPILPVRAQQTVDFTANFPRISAFAKPSHNLVVNSTGHAMTTSQTHVTQNHIQHMQQQQYQHQHHNQHHNQHQTSLHQNSTTTTSPPLSPISSVSSQGDDSSVMHTSSDFAPSRPSTPPHEGNHSNISVGAFPTPPSAESAKYVSRTAHLQQQQVSSTSNENNASAALASSKRPLDSGDSSDSSEEPSSKKFHYSTNNTTTEKEAATTKEILPENHSEDSMWRPW